MALRARARIGAHPGGSVGGTLLGGALAARARLGAHPSLMLGGGAGTLGAGIQAVILGLGVFGTVLGSVTLVLRHAEKELTEYAKDIQTLRNQTGLNYSQSMGVQNRFGMFGVNAAQQFSGVENMPMFFRARAAGYGLPGYEDPSFILRLAQRYQGFAAHGQVGQLMGRTMLSNLGLDNPAILNAVNTPTGQIQEQLRWQSRLQRSFGLDPIAIRRWAETMPLLHARVAAFFQMLWVKIGTLASPFVMRAMDFLTNLMNKFGEFLGPFLERAVERGVRALGSFLRLLYVYGPQAFYLTELAVLKLFQLIGKVWGWVSSLTGLGGPGTGIHNPGAPLPGIPGHRPPPPRSATHPQIHPLGPPVPPGTQTQGSGIPPTHVKQGIGIVGGIPALIAFVGNVAKSGLSAAASGIGSGLATVGRAMEVGWKISKLGTLGAIAGVAGYAGLRNLANRGYDVPFADVYRDVPTRDAVIMFSEVVMDILHGNISGAGATYQAQWAAAKRAHQVASIKAGAQRRRWAQHGGKITPSMRTSAAAAAGAVGGYSSGLGGTFLDWVDQAIPGVESNLWGVDTNKRGRDFDKVFNDILNELKGIHKDQKDAGGFNPSLPEYRAVMKLLGKEMATDQFRASFKGP